MLSMFACLWPHQPSSFPQCAETINVTVAICPVWRYSRRKFDLGYYAGVMSLPFVDAQDAGKIGLRNAPQGS